MDFRGIYRDIIGILWCFSRVYRNFIGFCFGLKGLKHAFLEGFTGILYGFLRVYRVFWD